MTESDADQAPTDRHVMMAEKLIAHSMVSIASLFTEEELDQIEEVTEGAKEVIDTLVSLGRAMQKEQGNAISDR